MLPVNQVGARGVTPVNAVPDVAKRVVLIKEMIAASSENQAVGVVHPAVSGKEVVVGSVGIGHGRGWKMRFWGWVMR